MVPTRHQAIAVRFVRLLRRRDDRADPPWTERRRGRNTTGVSLPRRPCLARESGAPDPRVGPPLPDDRLMIFLIGKQTNPLGRNMSVFDPQQTCALA
nr:hypothetical protein [Nitrosomonas nitrosa]